jgi:hypothetical protein
MFHRSGAMTGEIRRGWGVFRLNAATGTWYRLWPLRMILSAPVAALWMGFWSLLYKYRAPSGGTSGHPACCPALEGETMTEEPKPGDRVAWNTSQGETTGRVVEKQTSPTRIKGHKVAASEDNPQLIVESDRTGTRAAHRPGALKKR